MKTHIILTITILCLIVPSLSKNVKQITPKTKPQNKTTDPTLSTTSSVSYIKASIPTKIFRCMSKFNLFRCMKSLILQRMEANQKLPNSGNVTTDFLTKILAEQDDDGTNQINDYYLRLTETELNKRLYTSFQKFFNNREIKMHFIPGMMVKVVPSKTNLIDMSLKKHRSLSKESGRKKNKHYKYLLELGVPALFMPVVLLGSFLPMMLPALKMATFFTGAVNNAALLAALMYLARQAAVEQEQQNTVYYTPGSHVNDYNTQH